MLSVVVHHVAADGWSLGMFVRELSALYSGYLSGAESPLGELPLQYADYAVWQRARSDTRALDAGIAYWRDRLAGLSPLELPSARPRPPARSFRGARVSFRLPAPLVSRLHALCRAEGVTPFMALLAAFDLLLYRYTGQADIVGGDAGGEPRTLRGRGADRHVRQHAGAAHGACRATRTFGSCWGGCGRRVWVRTSIRRCRSSGWSRSWRPNGS